MPPRQAEPEPLRNASDLTQRARAILHEVCLRVGLDDLGAELLRLRSNAVFKLRRPVIVRIATAQNAAARLPAVLAITRWLSTQGFPTVRPIDEIPGQPLICQGAAVTFWHYVPTGKASATTSDLGRLLRRLHGLAPPIQLRTLTDPLASVRAAVEDQHGVLSRDDQTWLKERINSLTQAWHELPFHGPPTLLHGDAWIDNLLLHQDGHPVLGDWDSVATGPREWDLIHTYHGQHRFGLTPADVHAFATTYGRDLRQWPGYGTLLQIRDTYAIGIHIRNAPGDPFSRKELTHRLATLRDNTPQVRWHMKPSAHPTISPT